MKLLKQTNHSLTNEKSGRTKIFQKFEKVCSTDAFSVRNCVIKRGLENKNNCFTNAAAIRTPKRIVLIFSTLRFNTHTKRKNIALYGITTYQTERYKRNGKYSENRTFGYSEFLSYFCKSKTKRNVY